MALNITTEQFEDEVLKSDKPVLVDFWAEWCMPCKMVAPVLDQISADMGDKVKIAKVDVDSEGALAEKYNVVSIPTMLLFKGGEIVETKIGAAPREALEEMINRHV